MSNLANLAKDKSINEISSNLSFGFNKKKIRNPNKIWTENLNINPLTSKFEQFGYVIMKFIDIHGLTETRLDIIFPTMHILANEYLEPRRPDRNKNDGKVIIYTRQDIHSKLTFLMIWKVSLFYSISGKVSGYFLEHTTDILCRLLSFW